MALTTNLVNYWKLDGNSFDSVGGFTGTDTLINYAQNFGFINQGAAFNGNSSKITCSSLSAIRSQGAISVSVWVYCANITGTQTIIAQYNGAAQNVFVLQQLAAEIRLFISNGAADGGANYVTTSTAPLVIGTWLYITAVFDGSLTGNTNRARIYVNGVLQATTGTGTIPATTSTGTSLLYIGNLSGNSQFFPGFIDEIGIYARALPQVDIDSLYNSGVGTQYPYAGTVYANAGTVQFCQWLLTSNYYRFSTARTNAIADIQAAAIAGTVISEHDWNQFIYISGPFYNVWLSSLALRV